MPALGRVWVPLVRQAPHYRDLGLPLCHESVARLDFLLQSMQPTHHPGPVKELFDHFVGVGSEILPPFATHFL